MSEQAMKDAQLAQALKENDSLKTYSRNLSAQVASQKQCIEEFTNANIQLRANMLLLEDDVVALKNALAQHTDRISTLEKENGGLKLEIENLTRPEQEAA